jgi:hypothetical protein
MALSPGEVAVVQAAIDLLGTIKAQAQIVRNPRTSQSQHQRWNSTQYAEISSMIDTLTAILPE